jgi:hypothetical protein
MLARPKTCSFFRQSRIAVTVISITCLGLSGCERKTTDERVSQNPHLDWDEMAKAVAEEDRSSTFGFGHLKPNESGRAAVPAPVQSVHEQTIRNTLAPDQEATDRVTFNDTNRAATPALVQSVPKETMSNTPAWAQAANDRLLFDDSALLGYLPLTEFGEVVLNATAPTPELDMLRAYIFRETLAVHGCRQPNLCPKCQAAYEVFELWLAAGFANDATEEGVFSGRVNFYCEAIRGFPTAVKRNHNLPLKFDTAANDGIEIDREDDRWRDLIETEHVQILNGTANNLRELLTNPESPRKFQAQLQTDQSASTLSNDAQFLLRCWEADTSLTSPTAIADTYRTARSILLRLGKEKHETDDKAAQ